MITNYLTTSISRSSSGHGHYLNSLLGAITLLFLLLAVDRAFADSATWDLNPGSGDWNTAANWTPMTVPNGPADIATFGLSNTSNISISASTEVNGIVFTAAATNPYLITVNDGVALTLSVRALRTIPESQTIWK